MDGFWLFSQSKHRFVLSSMIIMSLLYQNLCLCCSLNEEGLALKKFRERVVNDPFDTLSNWNDDNGEINPCSWYGVECSEGKVIVLNLRDLCLGGTLVPEFGNLLHIKAIILRNNSLYGIIPEEIGKLNELEVLDLGFNNFKGTIPINLGQNGSLAILLLDNNVELSSSSPEIEELKRVSECQVDESQLFDAAKRSSCNVRFNTWSTADTEYAVHKRLMEVDIAPAAPNKSPLPSMPPSSSPSPSPITSPAASPTPTPNPKSPGSSGSNHTAVIVVGVTGSAFLLISTIGFLLWKTNKGKTIKPWAIGLSGQLQKAFVAGVPKLKRAELESACEDFSNVIVSSPFGTIYKGTLSSGVEIAVTSVAVKFASDWTASLEEQFRNKIHTLSKVNHKNFDNLLAFCEEEKPFTRMMVFEYTPNGTLFEHLHIKEVEHLDWGMRLRIAMGVAYCLEHMHQLSPPISHTNLKSSSVNLTEDYAAKVSDFSFWKSKTSEKEGLESNVYSYGVILFEIVTGRVPYSVDNVDWASDFLKEGERELIKEMVDPTLSTFHEEQLEAMMQVIKSCVNPDPSQRPTMKEVTERLREATAIESDGATPRNSPLWWAQLEIQSTEAS